jgi:2,5-diamino-6-(ribosylamino)-4(3H)-pyrimidinone 5'-phosphate reductase
MTPDSACERPFVVAHVAVSLDGATTGFQPDLSRFYGLISTWEEDVTLVGADTILAQERALADAPRPGPAGDAPLLAVVDSRRRVREWEALRDCGHWSGVVALRAQTGRRQADDAPREVAAGEGRVDLTPALAALARDDGARVVRVDSGGELVAAMLHDDLVDELSLLVHPLVAGNDERRWYGSGASPRVCERLGAETFDDGLVWLRYRLAR